MTGTVPGGSIPRMKSVEVAHSVNADTSASKGRRRTQGWRALRESGTDGVRFHFDSGEHRHSRPGIGKRDGVPTHPAGAGGLSRPPQVASRFRMGAMALATTLLVACAAVEAIQGRPEHRPVRILFDALIAYDSASLASTVTPDERTGDLSHDAETALSAALRGSELDLVANDLARRLGNYSGTTMSISSLELQTEAREEDSAWVLARAACGTTNDEDRNKGAAHLSRRHKPSALFSL